MPLGSLVGFAIVFLGASLALSVLLGALVLALGPVLRRMGPWVERRAAAWALVLPPLVALALVAGLAMSSALALAAGTDHCLAHDHHLHLCLAHGAEWTSQVWALATVAFATTFVAVRAGLSLRDQLLAQRSAGRLRGVATELPIRGCYLVPSRERFAFTVGLFSPVVLVSSAAWEALEADQRAAVLAHELGHVAHGDLRRRAALGLVALVGAPFLASRLLGVWALASERICDHRAALAVGRPSTVASAILALASASPPRLAHAAAVFAAASHVPERIRALLDEGPSGERPSRILSWLVLLVAACAAALFAVFAEPLHHALETILG
jgi:Zn-dependent protease with chaperone function